MSGQPEWEDFAPGPTQRLRVDGGWIYNVWTCEGEAQRPVFVPDARADLTQLRNRFEEEMREVHLEVRNTGYGDAPLACVLLAERIGLIARDQADIWRIALRSCPGHADDLGSRSWCAYCGDMKKESGND